MAVPVILSFLVKMAAKVGIKKARQMATKKYGKEALKNITKSKPVKKVTELQRVKAQIKRDMLKPKVKTPKGKIVGKVRRNYGKWEPVYRKPKKP
jgi:hypothetical protein